MLASVRIPNKLRAHLLLFLVACTLRLAFFFLYACHETRYQQPDSMDYHNCTLGLVHGTGMHRADTLEPIFWRTPGYPLFLAISYYAYPCSKTGFADWHQAHYCALILQIILCSLIPSMVLLLALAVTQQYALALTAGWATALHPGFILASMVILTEGLAVLLFLLFLYCWYRFLRNNSFCWWQIVGAALFLGAYTWMRPMGQFVAAVAAIVTLFLASGAITVRLKKTTLFLVLCMVTVMPWYVRNYQLTGQWFFCPMSGPYLNSFCAPKIVRSVKGLSLEQSIRLLYSIAAQRVQEAQQHAAGTGYVVARETVCGPIAWPIIQAYPWIFIRDWTKEVIKTTFDLYGYQLCAYAANSFRYDPLEEQLSEKLATCLYAQPVPHWMRGIMYAELIYTILLWLGIFGGFILTLRRLFARQRSATTHSPWDSRLWWQLALISIAVVGMTGGFGYARLRLPIEALLIIASLMWWYRLKKGCAISSVGLSTADN